MTDDKTTYTVEFPRKVDSSLTQAIESCANPDVLTVETEARDTTLSVTVWGSGYATPVFEQEMKEVLSRRAPDAEVVNADVEIGSGVENSP